MENMKGIYPPRLTLSPDVAEALRRGLSESQLSYREAAREIGISPGYLHALVHGRRCPRRPVARALIVVLRLDEEDAHALMQEAVDDKIISKPTRQERN